MHNTGVFFIFFFFVFIRCSCTHHAIYFFPPFFFFIQSNRIVNTPWGYKAKTLVDLGGYAELREKVKVHTGAT